MNITLHTLSTIELASLIQAASTELASRLGGAGERDVPVESNAPSQDVPSRDERDFCMYIKGLLQSGQYIKAAERERVAEIANRHGNWVARQGLPTESGTGAWRHAKHYHSAPRANVR